MPLRYIRSKVSADNAFNVVIATTAVTREIADLLQFPPAKAAASILLMVFQTIQSIQTNRSDCYRLARRCLSLLVDIRDAMEGSWETAPEALIRTLAKFEKTLESIHEYMKGEAAHKWSRRLLRKSTIEDALVEYNASLDDATRSFQVATLINIHLAVGSRSTSSKQALSIVTNDSASPKESPTTFVNLYSQSCFDVVDEHILTDAPELSSSPVSTPFPDAVASELIRMPSPDLALQPVSVSNAISAAIPTADITILDHRGFRRYHQSEHVIRSRSRIKEGWWAGAVEGDINGQRALMKRYEGGRAQAMQKWARDVKILQNLYHPNLPQMVGYSNDETPTPFILLANVQTRLPQALILDSIKNASLATCAHLLLRFYRDTLDAALYLQRQLNLSDSKTQDYVEHANYRIDAEQTVQQILPNRGYAKQPHDPEDATTSIETQRKVNHLAVLAKALLPNSDDLSLVSSRLQSILGGDEEGDEIDDYAHPASPLTLRQIRLAAFDAHTHQYAWSQNIVPAYKYAVGDIAYVPSGVVSGSFTVLCNVSAQFEIAEGATGTQGAWAGGFFERHELQPFEYPGGIRGWTVVVPVGTQHNVTVVHEHYVPAVHEAWRFLLENGRALAKTHNVEPQDLILVTRAGIDQRFRVQDLRQMHFPTHHHHLSTMARPPFQNAGVSFQPHFPFGQHQPHQPHRGFAQPFPGRELQRSIFYLFTAHDKTHEPRWSEQPFYVPGEDPPPLKAKCFAGSDGTYGFMNYVQLHAEDFAG
ncbi:hypothetical protein A0H81_05439 [Grifola frondosa]|uniref:Mixed lineage kinase domain-containing protein n=1 Tax=Grifola frondosa TaxID=5627 RepID=A0A1C7MCN8_GRIFR|nr:hypothetical protein A0H81_05439 [Grifola frondosa]